MPWAAASTPLFVRRDPPPTMRVQLVDEEEGTTRFFVRPLHPQRERHGAGAIPLRV